MPGYSIAYSPNNRATCKNTECKKNGVKIAKGEIRLGTLVEIDGHQSWTYKHWGCVTPAQIENIKKYIEGQLELLEGYDEAPEELQQKIERVLEQGHVDAEDWRGDAEMNVPGARGMRKPAPKKKAKKDGDDEADAESTTKPKKRGRPKKEPVDDDEEPAPKKKKAAVKRGSKAAKEDVDDDDEEEEEVEKPAKKARAPKKSKVSVEVPASGDGDEEEPKPAAKKSKPAKKAKTAEPAEDGEKPAPKKRGRKKKVVVEAEADGADEA